jgi:geranylgeranyl diphosphate synthase type II
MSLRALIDNRRRLGLPMAMRVLEEMQRMAEETVEGQAIELGWRRDNATHLSDADYLLMILKKTCWYTTIFPTRVGALIGTRDAGQLDRFLRFGFLLGAAFQIQDDLLNLVGDRERYGKELDGDIWEGKRTLILIHVLQATKGDERDKLVQLMGGSRSERTIEDVRWIRARMEAHGSIEYARKIAHALAGAALHECSLVYDALPDSRDKRFIEALPIWVLERT